MSRRSRLVGAALLLGLGVAVSATGSGKGKTTMIESQVADLMKNLDTLDERAQMKLLSAVDEQRRELLGVLLRHLGTSPSKSVQAAAIYLIGRHRLAEGARELMGRIDFEPGGQASKAAEPLWERYPAMEALITIGRPSVAPALELLATDTHDVRRDLATKVIFYVEDAGVAKFIVERAHAAETEPTRKRNLRDAVSRVEQLTRATR